MADHRPRAGSAEGDLAMEHVLMCREVVKSDFVRGRNCRLYDVHGREYLDFESGIWSAALGHAHPRVDRAMRAQLDNVVHLGTRYPSPLAEEAALDVLDIVGFERGKCVFLSSGSEALAFAVRAARRTTGRPLLVALAASVVGAHASTAGSEEGEWRLVERGAGEADLDTIPFEDVGAFVFEPGGSGSTFVRFPPVGLVQDIARRVQETGGLLVANEVTTGMGRTGRWFGFEHYDLRPDVVALGKALGNGYPVSAVALRQATAEKLEATGMRHPQSHQSDPLGCAVAREVIATMREELWVARGDAMGNFFFEGLRQLQKTHRAVQAVRGRGMLLGFELRADAMPCAEAACRMLFDRGFLVGCHPAGNLLRFSPALTIDKPDIVRLLEALDEVLRS